MRYLLILCGALFCLSQNNYAQSNNYDHNGHPTRVDVEKIAVYTVKVSSQEQLAPALSTILGSAITFGVGAYQSHLSAKQESYTATYTGRISEECMMISDGNVLSFDKLLIFRLTQKGNAAFDTSAVIMLSVKQDRQVFRFITEYIHLRHSKARLKRGGEKGKTVDLDINIKVDAHWNVYDVDSSRKKNPIKVTLESGTLGQSSITVNGIRPGVADTSAVSSEWFKIVPTDLAHTSYDERCRGWYTITVTVKEVNPFGVTSKRRAEFLKDNKDNVTDFLKGFIPAKKEEKEEEGGEQ